MQTTFRRSSCNRRSTTLKSKKKKSLLKSKKKKSRFNSIAPRQWLSDSERDDTEGVTEGAPRRHAREPTHTLARMTPC
jgi:hypothetical protein